MPGQQPKEPKDFGQKSAAYRPMALSVDLYQNHLISTRYQTRDIKNLKGTYVASNAIPAASQGGVKSTPSSPRLQVGVILTDPEPVKEAL